MVKIRESSMDFEFADSDLFRIEGSDVYRKLGKEIKTVEFMVRINTDDVAFVEAKSSSPRPDNKVDFDTYISEISDKFIDSFNLYLTVMLNRNSSNNISEELRKMSLEKINFKYILIIKGHKTDWLLPLKEAFDECMISHNKIWKSSVLVFNDELAKQFKFIPS